MKIRIHDDALKEIQLLDKRTAKQIMAKIEWLAKNADLIKPTGLRNNLSEFSKRRVGDYRILYTIDLDEDMLEIHVVGHRSEVYKR